MDVLKSSSSSVMDDDSSITFFLIAKETSMLEEPEREVPEVFVAEGVEVVEE